MKRFVLLATIPLFAGFLYAQTSQTTETQTTTTSATDWDGTLVDAGCMTNHTESRETTTNTEGSTTSTKTETTRVNCPVTRTTTDFGLMTADGRFIRFDQPSSTKVVEIVKHNKAWNDEIGKRHPVKVHVIGTKNGDTVVVEKIR